MLVKTNSSLEGFPSEDFVFKPLDSIQQESLRDFVVEVDWPDMNKGWDEKEKRFQLRRIKRVKGKADDGVER